MTEPLADRLLEALGDAPSRRVARSLLAQELSQTDLISELGVAQATVSRAVKILRAVGLVEPLEGGRAPRLGITATRETLALLLAADRLAEALIEQERDAQRERSDATRRVAVTPAKRKRAVANGDADLE